MNKMARCFLTAPKKGCHPLTLSAPLPAQPKIAGLLSPRAWLASRGSLTAAPPAPPAPPSSSGTVGWGWAEGKESKPHFWIDSKFNGRHRQHGVHVNLDAVNRGDHSSLQPLGPL